MIRPGCRLGLDVGQVRLGVAACDPEGILAFPVTTLDRRGLSLEQLVEQLIELIQQHNASEIIVGWPAHLSGMAGQAAADVEALAQALADASPVAVRLVDERLTTVQAASQLHSVGLSAKQQRAVIDQAAAVLILQSALDQERTCNQPPGQLVSSRVN
jgi:putative Holliday junction resolvase